MPTLPRALPRTNRDNVWPPLKTSVIALEDWPNSNRERATSSNTNERVANMIAGMTLGETTPHVSEGADPLGSGIPVFSASRSMFADTTGTLSGNQLGKRKTNEEVNLQNYTFTTPPLLVPSTLRLELTATSQQSSSGSVARLQIRPSQTALGRLKPYRKNLDGARPG